MNTSRPAILAGVDGGGSSTVAWVADASGLILARAESGPSNHKAVGEQAALNALDSSLRAAMSDASNACGFTIESFDVACLGLAGFDRSEDRAAVERWNVARGWAKRLILVNDGELVLAAGTPDGWGVAVIAGTGSIAVGRSPDGASARAGGWGHIFGDEGSGYGTAVGALRRVAQMHDGRVPGLQPDDVLTSTVCDAVGVPDAPGLVTAIYSPGFDRARIAAISAQVVLSAESDPSIETELLAPAGRALAETVRAVADQLSLAREGFPLAMAGGFLLSAKAVERALIDGLAQSGYHPVAKRVNDPVRGALVLAKRALDLESSGVGTNA